MGRLSFPESVEIEKGWGPLPEPVQASNKIRRDLFRGITVGVEPYTSERYGGTPALVNQIVRDMEFWGFEIEKVPHDGGRQGFKLINRDFVPVKKAMPEPKAREDGSLVGKRTGVRKKIREALLAGETMSSKQAVERYGGTEGNLRAVIASLRTKGHDIETFDHPTGTVFAVKKASRDREKKKTGTEIAVPKSNGSRLPVIKMTPNGDSAHNMLDLPPIPQFGAAVQVVGTFLNRDGVVTLALRDDEHDWLTSIEGASVVNSDD